jgi:ABC-type nitrate/sulfonate/bicarbonate transport system substrate-binding protein
MIPSFRKSPVPTPARRVTRRTLLGTAAAGMAIRTPRARAATSPLRLQGIWTNDPESIGYFIGIDEGDYARAGIDLAYLPGGPELIPEGSLLAGRSDIAMLSMINAAQAVYRKGADFRIVGAQYQKNPDAVISLTQSRINGPADLKGRTVACPPLSLLTFRALLRHAGIAADAVRIVPYTFDPTPLINGEIDAIVDYMTSLPWVIENTGGKPAHYFMISDAGLPLYSNVLVTTGDTLAARRHEIEALLSVSCTTWTRNFQDPTVYPKRYAQTWFRRSGLSLAALVAQNCAQQPLMSGRHGYFALAPEDVAQNIATLRLLGIPATSALFDPSLLAG